MTEMPQPKKTALYCMYIVDSSPQVLRNTYPGLYNGFFYEYILDLRHSS